MYRWRFCYAIRNNEFLLELAVEINVFKHNIYYFVITF